jgi:FKBP-type peptidyl-prolyl cis-trans isomerase FklB
MKTSLMIMSGILLLVTQVYGQEGLVLKDQKDKVSYAIGVDIANSLRRQSIEVNPDVLVQGIKDNLLKRKTLLSEQEMRDVLTVFQREMLTKQGELRKEIGEKNRKEGQAFLTANKQKSGIMVRPSGLQYKELQAGTGQTPKATDTVVAHYRGMLIDGTEFDSSYRRGAPTNFQVTGVIPGWTEALQLMKVGAKWQIFVPTELAYGERGVGDVIPPNAALIFEIELLGVK